MNPQIASRYGPTPTQSIVRGLAILALLTVAISLVVSANRAVAAASPMNGEVAQSFETSARHWHVPVSVLMAVGYVESHWEQRDGAPSIDKCYGIMHITHRADGTLARAVAL